MLRATVTLAIAAALCGCVDQRSATLTELQKLPLTEQVAFARSLPLPERLALYDEAYDASGHPKDRYLSDAFEGAGKAGFRAIEMKLKSPDDFSRYTGILYAIDRGGFDLCAEQPLAALKAAAARAGMENDRLSMIDLGPCELNDRDWQPSYPAYSGPN